MKLAVSIFKESISTVFDAADQVLIIETTSDGSRQSTLLKLLMSEPAQRALELKSLGVDVLICGAISRPMQASILSQGIDLHPFVRGSVEDVVVAYQDNRLGEAVYSLPGCAGRGRGRSGRCGFGSKRGRAAGLTHRSL